MKMRVGTGLGDVESVVESEGVGYGKDIVVLDVLLK